MGNKSLYDISKEKMIAKTRTNAVTQKTWPANPGNNWYSLVANTIAKFFLRKDIWKFSGYYLSKIMTSRNHMYNRAFQATPTHTFTHICTSEAKSNHWPTLNNLK